MLVKVCFFFFFFIRFSQIFEAHIESIEEIYQIFETENLSKVILVFHNKKLISSIFSRLLKQDLGLLSEIFFVFFLVFSVYFFSAN